MVLQLFPHGLRVSQASLWRMVRQLAFLVLELPDRSDHIPRPRQWLRKGSNNDGDFHHKHEWQLSAHRPHVQDWEANVRKQAPWSFWQPEWHSIEWKPTVATNSQQQCGRTFHLSEVLRQSHSGKRRSKSVPIQSEYAWKESGWYKTDKKVQRLLKPANAD